MDKNDLYGKATQMRGKLSELAGKLTHSQKLQDEGRADQLRGAAQEKLGQAKEALDAVTEKARSQAKSVSEFVIGSHKITEGEMKEAMGKACNDLTLEVEGKVEQADGKMHHMIGSVEKP